MKFSLLFIIMSFAAFTAKAESYLIDSRAVEQGSQIVYKNQSFTVGTTAFASFDAFNAANPISSSTLYVAPGTYSGATISTYGLKVYGANAFRDNTVTRGEESVFTGILDINAGAVEVNGFSFTGAGRVRVQSATNESPLYSIKVRYNVFSNSTVERTDGISLITIGSRYADANANNAVSQRRYANCTVSYNTFNGGGSHLANSIGVFGVFGTTNIEGNYVYDGGSGVHLSNAQGVINVFNNKFHYVGVTAASNPDGKGVGAFTVYAERSAYANSTTLNIADNEFDHCYGKTSYMALLRIYPGTAGSTNCVAPVAMSVNINGNTFTNKTSLATNANQLGQNVLLYSDLGTTADVKYSIADNHYDHRFYKYSYVTLADSWGQREIYSNTEDQFTIAGKYSTMGTSVIDGVDISNHLIDAKTADTTVIQSMDIDPVTGDIYMLQLMGSTNKSSFNSANGLSTTECDPLFLIRIPCTKKATKTSGTYTYSTSIQKMSLAKTGHGVKLSVFRDKAGQLWMVTGAKGSDNGTGNDLSGKAICKFKFVSGAKVIADGRENSTVSLSYHNHPKGYNNAYADIDPVNRFICYSSSGGGARRYCVYDLDAYLEGKDVEIKDYYMPKGNLPVTGSGVSGDTGFEWKSYQSFCINGDYLYLFEGVGSSSNSPVLIMSIVNWRTNTYIQRKSINYGRINGLEWGEPEAVCIRPDVFGHACMYLGISRNSTYANVYKFHIDRHVDSSGEVIGDDTVTGAKHFDASQYSGISMSASQSSVNFAVSELSETSQTVTITRNSEYMYGKWNACITGEDGNVFAAEIADHSRFAKTFDVKVTFTPDGLKNNYSAYLKLTSPGASDIRIPITATSSSVTPDPEPEPTPDPDPTFEGKIDGMEQKWIFSETKGNLADATWLSTTAPQSRDLAVNDGKLYIVNSNAALNASQSVQIVNAYTGASIGTLNLANVTGGQTYAASIKAFDGKIILSNSATSTHSLKVYRWEDDAIAPTVILEDETHGGIHVGDIMSVYGNWTSGKLMFSNGSSILVYEVSNGAVNSTPQVIALTDASGNAYSVGAQKGSVDITLNDDGSYWVIGKDKAPTRFDSTGKYIEQVSSSVINGNANAGRFFTYGTQKYMAATTYLNINTSDGNTTLHDGALVLKNITDGIASDSQPQTYPAEGLGVTRNVQFQQAVCYEIKEYVLNIWVLSCLQGVAYYTFDGNKSLGVSSPEATPADLLCNGETVTLIGTDAARISLYNLSGTLLATTTDNTLSISHIPSGLYIIQAVDTAGNVIAKKIMK